VSDPDLLPLIVVACGTLVAAGTDLWKFKVYNALTFPMLLSGPLASALLGGAEGLKASLLGAALGFGVLAVFFAMGGVGAGDVKLLTAVGAWLGPFLTVQVFVASALAGGVYALVLMALRGGVREAFWGVALVAQRLQSPGPWTRPETVIAEEVRRADRRRRLIPFAAMTCLGFFVTLARWGGDLDEVWPPYERLPRASLHASPPRGPASGRASSPTPQDLTRPEPGLPRTLVAKRF